MRLRWCQYIGWTARGLMLAAIVAFVQEGTVIAASQAAAFAGSMPNPAVLVSGELHVHDALAGNMHSHGGNTLPGHVHHSADNDDDGADVGKTVVWSLGCTSAVLPTMAMCSFLFDVPDAPREFPSDRRDGIEPDGLSRPPSTPSIV